MTLLRVVSAGGLALVQDGGRPGRMHEGVPPGGALAPELLHAANVGAGNPPGAAAIEHYGPLTVEATAPLVAATSDALLLLGPGQPARLLPRRARVGYLAVAGGLDVPVVLGGRGTLLVAGIGGLEGRALRAGDTLRTGVTANAPSPPRPPPPHPGPFRVILGPDHGDTSTLLSEIFTTTSIGDRTGLRLSGPPVRARTPSGISGPMVRGALQTTPSGELVVLGPDHPTTGGYPVVAVVVAADVGRLLAALTGTAVRFVR